MYVGLDLLLVLAFTGVLVARGITWWRREQVQGDHGAMEQIASWIHQLLDVFAGDMETGESSNDQQPFLERVTR